MPRRGPPISPRFVTHRMARDVLGRQLGMPYLFAFETERLQLLEAEGVMTARGKRMRLCHGEREGDPSAIRYPEHDQRAGSATIRPT